eukprot:gene3007-82_t
MVPRRPWATKEPTPDYYKVLGIPRDAKTADIRSAYKKLADDLHPDKQSSEQSQADKDRFAEVNRAYEILRHPKKKKDYDRTGIHVPCTSFSVESIDQTKWQKQEFEENSDVMLMTESQWFEAAEEPAKATYVVLFWSKNFVASLEACPCPCPGALAIPLWTEMAQKYRHVVRVAAVNCDSLMTVCRTLSFHQMPQIALIKKGENIRWWQGRMDKLETISKIEDQALPGLLPVRVVPQLAPEAFGAGCFGLVSFEWDTCAHCLTDFRLTLSTLQGRRVKAGRIDCQEHDEFCISLGLGYDEITPWMYASVCPKARATPTFSADSGVAESPGGEFLIRQYPADTEANAANLKAWMLASMPNPSTDVSRDFSKVKKSDAAWIVGFHTSDADAGCKACKNFMSVEWPLTATEVDGMSGVDGQPLLTGLVDCAASPRVCIQEGVNVAKLPTVQVYSYGDKSQKPPVAHQGVLVAPYIAQSGAKEAEPAPDIVLNPDNIKELFYQSEDRWVVLWQAGQWCPPCMGVKSFWRDAARELMKHHPFLKIGIVDCDDHKDLCAENNIGGYPTLNLYGPKRSNVVKHSGDRSPRGYVDFINDILNSKLQALTPKTLDKAIQESDHYLVVFNAGEWCPPCQAMIPVLHKASAKLDGKIEGVGQIDCDTHRNKCNDMDIQAYPATFMYKKKGTQKIQFEGNSQHVQSVVEFVMSNMGEDMVIQAGANLPEIVQQEAAVFVLFNAGQWCPPCNMVKPQWKRAAQLLQGTVQLVSINCDNHRDVCNSYDIG